MEEDRIAKRVYVGCRSMVVVTQWFGPVERMEEDRIAKRVYVRRAGSHPVGRPQRD